MPSEFYEIGNQTMSNFYNEQLHEISLTFMIVLIVLGILIIIPNLIVVTTSGLIVKKGLEPRCTYLLLGNLSLADTIIGVLTVVITAFLKDMKYQSRVACCFQIGLFTSTLIVSVYTVGLIAIDRFLYIIYGIKYHQLVYPKRVGRMIIITWVFALLIGHLPLFGWSKEWKYGTLCRYSEITPKNLLITTVTIATVPIPLILVTYTTILVKALRTIGQIETEINAYANRIEINDETIEDNVEKKPELRIFRGGSKVIITVSEKVQEISSSASSSTSNNNDIVKSVEPTSIAIPERYNIQKKKWKAIKVVLFTTAGYILSWTPIFIDSILVGICDDDNTPEKCFKLKNLSKYLSILTFVNCLLNPIIYAWWHNGFRKAAKKIFRSKRLHFESWYRRRTN